MNFLAHLYIAEARGADLAGALLGDVVRGTDLSMLPPPLAESVRLHRRIDATFDRHPATQAVRRQLPPRQRRWAAITLDLCADHWLARHWTDWHPQSLEAFSEAMAAALARHEAAFAAAGRAPPPETAFRSLLLGLRQAEGIDRAIDRIAGRSRYPQRLRSACRHWPEHGALLEPGLPALLRDCLRA